MYVWVSCDFERALNTFANIHFRADIKAVSNIVECGTERHSNRVPTSTTERGIDIARKKNRRHYHRHRGIYHAKIYLRYLHFVAILTIHNFLVSLFSAVALLLSSLSIHLNGIWNESFCREVLSSIFAPLPLVLLVFFSNDMCTLLQRHVSFSARMTRFLEVCVCARVCYFYSFFCTLI